MTIDERSYELPNGKKVEGYLHLDRPNYILVVAVDDQNQIAVEKQYRRGVDEYTNELPAGWIEKGEENVDAAVRELKEETGLIGNPIWSQEIYAQPGFSSMRAFVVMVKISQKENPLNDADENIKYEMKSLDKIRQMVRNGEIKDMGFLAALEIYSQKNNI